MLGMTTEMLEEENNNKTGWVLIMSVGKKPSLTDPSSYFTCELPFLNDPVAVSVRALLQYPRIGQSGSSYGLSIQNNSFCSSKPFYLLLALKYIHYILPFHLMTYETLRWAGQFIVWIYLFFRQSTPLRPMRSVLYWKSLESGDIVGMRYLMFIQYILIY